MIIESGSGKLYQATVDATNRLSVRAVSKSPNVEASVDGNQFFISSGEVTLTNDAQTGLFYYENVDDVTLIFDRIIFSAGISTGGTTNLCKIQSHINPTGMSSGSSTEVVDINTNFGSSNIISTTTSEIGQTGASITGGTSGPAFYYKDEATSIFETFVVLPKGSSLGFSVTPPASNTSLAVSIAIEAYILKEV